MSWINAVGGWSHGAPSTCGLQLRVLRHLIAPSGVSVGARILDLAPAGRSLAPFLRYLGFDAAEGSPDDDFAALPEHEFDLILLRDAVLPGNLCGAESYAATAQLLAALRPAGRFALVVRQEPDWQTTPGGHLRSCFARHFAPFPGTTQVCYFADGWTHPQTWSWLCGSRPRSGHLTASLRLEATPLSRSAWLERARDEARCAVEPCCQWARREVLPAAPHAGDPTQRPMSHVA